MRRHHRSPQNDPPTLTAVHRRNRACQGPLCRGRLEQPRSAKVSLAYTSDSRWRNRCEFVTGREAITTLLTRKWQRELDYRLIKELCAWSDNRIAVRYAYEWRGEHTVQDRLGVRDIEDWARKVVLNYLPQQHRAFHTAQPFLLVSARDEVGRPWVTLLSGSDGFVTSPDPQHLVINAKPTPGDALENAFVADADVGILGIELGTRRRNRVNARVAANDSDSITFRVDQTFGNCPQYIREREWQRVDNKPSRLVQRSKQLSSRQRQWIEAADTFFIASGFRGDGDSPTFGMDASHRGGERGFVQVLNDTRVRFPDYSGNNHYNTIGNLVLDPRAGYLFIDFETGTLLQITGKASINWDSAELLEFAGARRLLTLEVGEIIELPAAVGLRWQADAESVRSLRLIEKIPESDDVTSFVFAARDGGPLAVFEPGRQCSEIVSAIEMFAFGLQIDSRDDRAAR